MKKKIAVLFPAFMGGGAECVCAWMLEALKEEYDVTLFTLAFNDFQELNRLYGTTLSEKEIRVVSPLPRIARLASLWFFSNFDAFRSKRQKALSRFYRSRSGGFDLAISAYNEMDLGKPGIQYLHWIDVVTKKGNGRPEAIKKNLTLANSECSAGYIKQEYGLDARVVYPPVVSDFPVIPWEEKKDGFVIIGRLVQAKSPHIAVRILEKVRQKGFDVHLHIIGSGGNWKYIRFLKKLQKERAEWMFLDQNVSHDDFCRLLSGHRYGIHWKQEPFGIVTAEMMKAGCIPFVREGGAAAEILGEMPAISFKNIDEAAEKIIAVLADSHAQKTINQALSLRKELFSAERFMGDIRRIVANFLRQEKG